jgi:DNA-binding NtrC family response regulator
MQHRILTVDDDSEARLAVQAILERQQILVTLAESAEDGLAALSGAHFDLVITDFRMKQKTGLDLS